MDRTTFQALLGPGGQGALAEADALIAAGATELTALDRLRRRFPTDLAAAAYEQASLRRKAGASGKFARAAAMYFTREALEQATGETIAQHHARRYAPFGSVADLGCGIGGDALVLARAHPTLAVDRDSFRLLLAQENARVCGVAAHFHPVCADLLTWPVPRVEALFCDPGRRTTSGRRVFTTSAYQPPLALVRSWQQAVPALGVKVSPGIDRAEFPTAAEAEVEFISERGELKEAVLWFGPLRSVARRATLLPAGVTMTGDETAPFAVPSQPPRAILYEPDPAVIRAGLVEQLAVELDATKLDRDIAYLTADRLQPTPLARAFRILEALPFSLKRLSARLREHDAGIVTVKKRGSPLDTDALARQLRGRGAQDRTVILTHVLGRPYALICTPVEG